MGGNGPILRAHSGADDARQAACELHAGLRQDDLSLVVFFCSSQYDLDALGDEMNRLFPGVTVVGCTTAGEIGPLGYRQKSLVGASFAKSAGVAASGRLAHLQQFEIGKGQSFAQLVLGQLEAVAPSAPSNTFALLLVDGLSIREEPVVRTLQAALGRIPLVGGSAGDDMRFARTRVFQGGAFHDDSAVLLLFNTHLPFKTFKTQHFVSEKERLVVTEADEARRIVKEINGLPAAEEYARVVGTTIDKLSPQDFAAFPVVVVIDGTDYVRAIQKFNPDGSLTFYCAIEEGLVLRVARGHDMVADLDRTFARLRDEIGEPALVFGCDCILRHLEMVKSGRRAQVSELLERNKMIGFSTYGEQFGGVHISQTLTGIAIGKEPAHA